MTVILTSDKGSYSGTETPIFTVTYDPGYAGKEVILSTVSMGNYTNIATKIADASGKTTFTYRPSNKGTYVFVAQVTPCWIILNCETSNKVTISILGDLPCDPLDPLCNIGQIGTDYSWVAYVIIIVVGYMILRDTGMLKRFK